MNAPLGLRIASISMVLSGLAVCGGAGAANVDEQAWREECGACHIAYPARFLPAASWKQIMSTLSDHFGTDASVAAATAEKISRYLASVAGPPSRGQSDRPVLRITETRWFLHEHGEIGWRDPRVQSAANCVACHRGAEAGFFGDD